MNTALRHVCCPDIPYYVFENETLKKNVLNITYKSKLILENY